MKKADTAKLGYGHELRCGHDIKTHSDADRMQTWTRLGMDMILRLTKLTNPQGNENLHQIFIHVAKENCGLATLSHGSGMRQGHCMRTQMITCQMCNYQTVPSKECWVNINTFRGMLCQYQTTPTEEFYTHIGAVLAAAIG